MTSITAQGAREQRAGVVGDSPPVRGVSFSLCCVGSKPAQRVKFAGRSLSRVRDRFGSQEGNPGLASIWASIPRFSYPSLPASRNNGTKKPGANRASSD